jgi:hypothetical protein
MRLVKLIYILFWILTLSSCTENSGSSVSNTPSASSPQQAADTFVVEPEAHPGELTELFTFHRKLNLPNGLSFHVLALGQPASGSYLIIKSDDRGKRYTSITGNKKGRIVQAYATDMDADKQIEIIIAIESVEDRKGTLIIHEIDSLNNQTKITLPELTSDFSEGYQGQDTFFVKGNKIIREFPVSPASNDQKVSTRRIEYVLSTNTLLPSMEGGQ